MEERELPVGWEIITLSEAATWGSRGTPSRKNPEYYGGTFPWVKTGELGPRILTKTEETISELGLVNSSAKLFPAGSIAVAMYGATIGKVSMLGVAAATNQACAVAVADPLAVRTEFLFHYLCSQRDEFANAGKGGAQPNISQGLIKGWLFPLAPLNEQRRIAAKLDTTLAAVEACRQRLDSVAAILKRFRQAVLAAATSGELTREWREERGLSTDSWAQATIIEISEQVFDGPFGSNLKSEDYTSEGFRVVRLENLSHLHFLEEKRTFVSSAKFALLQKHVLFEDDNLFSSFVDEEVRTCLLPSALSGMSINKADCFCIRVNRNLCLPGFVVSVLSCYSTFKSVNGLVHDATRPRINLKQLKSLSIALPSFQEQFEILRRQEQIFTLADQLEARLNAARKVVDRLTPALLAKAFRGELVPQDPGDEPASVLLERLAATRRAARQAEAGAGKPSRRGRPKAAANPDQLPLDAAPIPPDFLAGLLRECGALSERVLLAVSELEPERFEQQLFRELERGTAREVQANGQVLLEAVS
jgi:type I restriction enzyme S subunit